MCQFALKCNVLIELETVAILPVAVQRVWPKSHQLYGARLAQSLMCAMQSNDREAVRMSICQIKKSKRITRYPVEVLKLGLKRYCLRGLLTSSIDTKGKNYEDFDNVVDDDP